MTEKIVQARKKSEDPKQEALREQKAAWNVAVSRLVSKIIAFKRAINGRGDIKAGLPPSNIKNPFSPEVSSYLHGLASDFADITQGADYIIKSQQEYSMTRQQARPKQQGVIQASSEENSIISQASWWGSRLWARMHLKGLPKNIVNLRLEMLRSAAYLKDGLEDVEDSFYSNDTNRIISGINNMVVLSVGMTNTLLNKYNLLLKEHNILPEAIKDQMDYEPPPAPASKPGISDDHKVKISIKDLPEVKRVMALIKELPNMQLVLEFIKQDKDINLAGELKSKLITHEHVLKSNLLRFDAALKVTGSEQTIDMQSWAKNIISSYNQIFDSTKNILKNNVDVSSALNFNDLVNILRIINEETDEKKQAASEIELKKIAANVVTRWINRRLLRMNPSAENDIKLSFTEQIIVVIRNLGKVMDLLEEKESYPNTIKDEVTTLINNYILLMQKFKIFVKIFYIKQDEVRSTKEQPLLRIKSSIFRDIDNIIKKLSIYINIVDVT